MAMMINLDRAQGSEWTIAPQSSQGTVTILRINENLSMNIMVTDDWGNTSSPTIPYAAPSGYFELRIEVEKATSQFTVYFDQHQVFSGRAGSGNISSVFFAAQGQTTGSILDIDNFSIREGSLQSWLTLHSDQLTVPAEDIATISITLNAGDLLPGSYRDTLILTSLNTENPGLNVPVTLKVKRQDMLAHSMRENVMIQNQKYTSSLSVYPVPATDKIQLEAEGIGEGFAELWLINSFGDVVYHERTTVTAILERQLSLNDIAVDQGIYLLRFRTAEIDETHVIIKK